MHVPSGDEKRKVFRSKYLPGFLATLFLCGMMEWTFVHYGRPHSLPQLAVAVLFIALFTVLVVFLYRIIVVADGIYAYTWHGVYRYLSWQEIVSVSRMNIPGFGYLRVASKKGAVVWVPLFLKDFEQFRETVSAHAGDPQHPLVKYLADHPQ